MQNIQSVVTLLGTPVHLLVNANILSASDMAATQCIKSCRYGREVQLFFRANIGMEKKCDLSDFDRGVIVGARRGGLSISETADLLGFSRMTASRVY